jgi:hypothetical protein
VPTKQLDITGGFEKETFDERRNQINSLLDRATELYEEWAYVFGIDTPIPIDKAWHNLTIALENIQKDSSYRDRISLAKEGLNQAEWLLKNNTQ